MALKNKLESINDGETALRGSGIALLLLLSLLFECEGKSYVFVLGIIFAVVSALCITYASRCHTLQVQLERLVMPLLVVAGLAFMLVIPITADELPVPGFATYGDGDTFARIFSLPSFWLAKLFGAGLEASCYFARFFNLICCSFLIAFSIYAIPYCKSIIAVIALMPASIRSIATASPTGTTLVFSMLFISLALRSAFTKEGYILSLRLRVLLVFSAFLMIVCNISCLPFAVLVFMIPASRFGNKKQLAAAVGSMAVLIIAAVVLWIAYAPIATPSPVAEASRTAQLVYILSNPATFIMTFLRTLMIEGNRLLLEVIGSVPVSAESSFSLPWPFISTNILSLIYVIYFDSGISPKRKYSIRTCAFGVFCYIFAIFTTYYMSKTVVAASTISGLTGSLLLPVLLPSAIFIKRMLRHPAAEQKNCSIALLFVVMCDIAAALSLYFAIH